MVNKIKLFLLITMISLFGNENNAKAKYKKPAYDFAFKDIDEVL